MKNKIILSSVTLLSAFILAACGNGEKKTTETTAEPTTEVAKETTAAPTTTAQTTTPGSSSGAKAVSYTDTQRIGRDDIGYVNVPKDWILTKSPGAKSIFQYSSKDELPDVILNAFTINEVPLQDRFKFVATTCYNTLKSDEHMTNNIDGEWTKVAGVNAYVLKAKEKMAIIFIIGFSKKVGLYTCSPLKVQRKIFQLSDLC